MVFPDYEKNNIVNLTSSILREYGLKPMYQPLDDFVIPKNKRIVYIILDGLGLSFLEKHGKDSCLYKMTKKHLTSVFPSTTTSALTSLMVGTAPLQHALTGWFMYFKKLGTASLALPFAPRFTDTPFNSLGVNITDIFNFETIFRQIHKPMLLISPSTNINSAFSKYCFGNIPRIGFKTIEECFTKLGDHIKKTPISEIIYTYIPHFDEVAHHNGINSQVTIDLFHKIDSLYKELIEKNPHSDTFFIVTADHGLIDATKDTILHIDNFPSIKECLILPLCGEPRVAYCYVRPAKHKQFVEEVEKLLSHVCDRYSMQDILANKLYGLYEPNPQIFDRIGDEILIMKDNYVLIDKVYHEVHKDFVGFHGGLTYDEMMVPLIYN